MRLWLCARVGPDKLTACSMRKTSKTNRLARRRYQCGSKVLSVIRHSEVDALYLWGTRVFMVLKAQCTQISCIQIWISNFSQAIDSLFKNSLLSLIFKETASYTHESWIFHRKRKSGVTQDWHPSCGDAGREGGGWRLASSRQQKWWKRN